MPKIFQQYQPLVSMSFGKDDAFGIGTTYGIDAKARQASNLSRMICCDDGLYYGISSLIVEMVLVSSTSDSLFPDMIERG